ncbi:18390_t:CDS:2, partial [Racocetra fulgida]
MGQLASKLDFLKLRRFCGGGNKAASTNTTNTSDEEGFRIVGGRKFHDPNTIKYPYPVDDEESDRLHLQHFWTRYIWQSNFSAPIENLLNYHEPTILDIGYPNANIVGLDITVQQPTQIKPSNFTFVKANVLDGLPFDDNTFDYVFQRYMIGGYPKEKWPFVINELVRVLKPEIAAMGKRGTDSETSKKLKIYLENQGELENITKEVRACYHGERANTPGIGKA